MKEYKDMLQNVYNSLCAALTAYEDTKDFEDYDKGFILYKEIVNIQSRLAEFLN